MATPAQPNPLRLLVVLPSWVGDSAMATPTLRMIRQTLPGSFIGGLCRPGIDQLLAGSDLLDELHVERASGVMGPKFAAAKIRPRRYDAALLLTNSFSTALTVRIAGIPRRIGYDRDARGLLLTDRMPAPTRPDGSFAPVPAVNYYYDLARRFLVPSAGPMPGYLELATTPVEESQAESILERAAANAPSLRSGSGFIVLNPGGNNPAKRWPAPRFAQLASDLFARHGVVSIVNGSPGERDLVREIVSLATPGSASGIAELGIALGSLKAIVRRSRLMVTNDTGPRHIAAAFGVPLISLFGPTDHRWTTIPTKPTGTEALLLADPTLPADQLANDHPERCRIENITLKSVVAAAEASLTNSASFDRSLSGETTRRT